MSNREQYRRIIRAAFGLVLLLVHAWLFHFFWMRYYSPQMGIHFYRRGHWAITAFYIFWMYLTVRIYGGWRVGYLRIFNLIFSQWMGILISNVLIYIVIAFLTRHFESPLPIAFLTLIQLALAFAWGYVCSKIYVAAYPPRKVLVVYGDRKEYQLLNKFRTRKDRFILKEWVSVHVDEETLLEKVQQYEGVVIGDIPSIERNKVLKLCYGLGIRTYLTPKLSDIIIRSAETQHMFDTPIFMARNTGLTFEQRFFKRLMDIVVSLLALAVFSPFMLVTAAAIHLEDGGPIFYSQERLTKDGQVFRIYKFRSMRQDAEADGHARLAEVHDKRITRVGEIIRATRMDEIPQFINILRGEMSVVGPRPERPEIAAEYEKDIPEFAFRLKVKAGLTGFAQVYGKYNTTPYDKLKLDLMYIQNYRLSTDFEIIFRTLQIIFMKESTEGVKHK